MTRNREEYIKILAHEWWDNADKVAPECYITEVINYIQKNPSEFSGYRPMEEKDD